MDSFWQNTLAGAIGGLVGGLLSLFAHRWTYAADRRSEAAAELRVQIERAADVATEFWLLNRAEEKEAGRVKQVEVRAQLYRAEQYLGPFISWCTRKDSETFQKAFGAFSDAVTGGDFFDEDRSTDAARALELQTKATDAIVQIRDCLLRSIELRTLLEHAATRR